MTSHLQKVGKFKHNVDITTVSDENNIPLAGCYVILPLSEKLF